MQVYQLFVKDFYLTDII